MHTYVYNYIKESYMYFICLNNVPIRSAFLDFIFP